MSLIMDSSGMAVWTRMTFELVVYQIVRRRAGKVSIHLILCVTSRCYWHVTIVPLIPLLPDI